MNYFDKAKNDTGMRFWINNPNGKQMEDALAIGAFSATTNPAYCSKILKSDPEYMEKTVDRINREGYANDSEGALKVYFETVKRLLALARPIFDQTGGRGGFVTMQDDPRFDEDTDHIVNTMLKGKKLGPNFMAKIPVINGGIQAIRECVRYNIPICATEVFGPSQARVICRTYNQACDEFGNQPPIFVTHITGIFDECLQRICAVRGIEIAPGILAQAGLIAGRKEYAILSQNRYPVTMLGGGARTTEHLTGLAGGSAHVTINWSTVADILEQDPEYTRSIETIAPEEVIQELRSKIHEFAQAYDDDGMSVEEFAQFRPVQHFRNSFLEGWYTLLSYMAKRRQWNTITF